MPFPKTKNMGKAMTFLKKDKPNWPRKQKIAVALKITGKGKKQIGRKRVSRAIKRAGKG